MAILSQRRRRCGKAWRRTIHSSTANKRTAFAATYTFLAINGVRITAEANIAYAFINTLYEAGTFECGRLIDWLRSNASPVPETFA